MTIFSGLGAALRLLRESRGLTQTQVAEKVAIGQPALSEHERREGEPAMEVETLGRLLDGYEADLAELGRFLQLGASGEGMWRSRPPISVQLEDAFRIRIAAQMREGELSAEEETELREKAPDLMPPAKPGDG